MSAHVIFKKITPWILPFLVAPLIVPVTFFIEPKQASAQLVPVGDFLNTGPHFENAAQNTARTTKEFALDAIITTIAKTIVKQIVRSTITWINSGFQGSPAFIQNPGKFFTGIADQIAGQFIERLGLGFLCEPFRLNLRLQLALEYGGPNFTDEIGCTFSDVLGNIEGFVEGDFAQGGWGGWFQVTQNRNNNPYGVYTKAKASLDISIATAQGEEGIKLDWGDGFQSLTDAFGDILTPGATIKAQLDQVLGSDLAQLIEADEINEIVGALVGQLTSQLMSATGLAGSGSSSSSFNSTNPSDAFTTNPVIDPTFDNSASADGLFQDTLDASQAQVDALAVIDPGFGAGEVEQRDFNLALRSDFASQSGNNEPWEDAGRAVDGSRTFNYIHSSFSNPVSITALGSNPFWQVDLRNVVNIGDVRIVRRSDTTAAAAVGKFRLFVSLDNTDAPFPSDFSTLAETWPSGVTGNIFATPIIDLAVQQANNDITLAINSPGRFVRIQRVQAPSNYLQLAEVFVIRNNKPVINPNGGSSITLPLGTTLFVDPGLVITDDKDPEVNIPAGSVTTSGRFGTFDVVIAGDVVNTSIPGTYRITYDATDSGGAKANQKVRTVTVQAAP